MVLSKNTYLLILIFFSSFAAICATLFTPALPEIAHSLKISPQEAQKSISLFLVGYAFGFLPWGPLANDIGRKKATRVGTLIAIFGVMISMMIKLYPHTWLMNTGRLLTAFGSSVGVKITYTYISDLFSKEEILGKLAYLLISSAAATSLASAAGGFLTSYFGWFSCLVAMLVYGTCLLLISSLLPETLKSEHRVPLNPKVIVDAYTKNLKNQALIKAGIMMGSCTSFTYLFASQAPFIAMNEMGLKPKQYGVYNFIGALGIITGFYLIQILKSRMKSLSQIKLGLIITAFFALLMAWTFFSGHMSPYRLFISISCIYVGLAIVFANASSLALSTSSDKSNASSMMNFVNMSFCCLVLFLNEAIPVKASTLMPLSFVVLCLCIFLLWLRLKKDPLIHEEG